MLRLDFTNFYSIFQSIFQACLNEGIPHPKLQSKRWPMQSLLAVCTYFFSGTNPQIFGTLADSIGLRHVLIGCLKLTQIDGLLADSTLEWNMKLEISCVYYPVSLSLQQDSRTVYGSRVSMYSPPLMNNLKMPSVRKVHPCSEIEVYLLRMLFLARVTFLFCPFWMDVHGILPSNPTRSELVQRVFVVNYS